MKLLKPALGLGAAALVVPALAAAAITEVGKQPDSVVPACPASPCRAISRTTGFQAKEGTSRAVHVIPRDGRVVAWTITLAKPGPTQVSFFDKNLGGPSKVQLTIVRPGRKLYYRVIAQGEPQLLAPYFGQTVTFPLNRSIPVKKGMVVGLSVLTWAPALGLNQPGTSSWRASRKKGTCDDLSTPTAQTGTNNVTRFYCLYRTARLTYSATVVPDPVATGKPGAGPTTPQATTTTPTGTTTTGDEAPDTTGTTTTTTPTGTTTAPAATTTPTTTAPTTTSTTPTRTTQTTPTGR